jgi:hypothetical protein
MLQDNIDKLDNMNDDLNNIVRYSYLNRKLGINFTIPTIIAYLPELTNDDYIRGYVVRNFVQKVNDDAATITEIDGNNHTEIQANAYYKIVKIKWRLIGTPQEIMDSNKASIGLVISEMKNLKLYLSNLLQFAKV